MVKNSLLILGCVLGFTWGPAICVAQQNEADIHVTVDMVQLSVAVTTNPRASWWKPPPGMANLPTQPPTHQQTRVNLAPPTTCKL